MFRKWIAATLSIYGLLLSIAFFVTEYQQEAPLVNVSYHSCWYNTEDGEPTRYSNWSPIAGEGSSAHDALARCLQRRADTMKERAQQQTAERR